MAESTLSITYDELRSDIGDYLGYGRTSGNWSSGQSDRITAAMKKGLRDFYDAHPWQFLNLEATLTCVASTGDYALPDNFASLQTDFVFDAEASSYRLHVVPVAKLHALRATTSTVRTGKPEVVAVTPMLSTDFDGTAGQRFEAYLWPTPDDAYVFNYRYVVNPNVLTSGNPYPYGGQKHSGTIQAACLAAAESLYNDELGVRTTEFQQRLAASMLADSQLQARYFGYNADHSDNKHRALTRSQLHREGYFWRNS